jgi:hypothetical protein
LGLVLINIACGIWMSKYKSRRPEDKWSSESKKDKKKAKKTQEGPVATSDAYFPQSDAPGEHYESKWIPQDVAPPPPTQNHNQTGAHVEAQEEPQLPTLRPRASSVRLPKQHGAMTSGVASSALRRAIQSSPARWNGNQTSPKMGSERSPIELDEDMGNTRRLLFPSPRKDNSPKVLGEVETNTISVHRATTFTNPKEALASSKENCPPTFADCDDDILRLFEEDIGRPSTPTQKSPPSNPFKTPTRPTPSHRPVTRSQSRSAKSANKILMTRTPSKTPNSVTRLRRSPRINGGAAESPFTASLHRLLDEAADRHLASPSRLLGADIEFASMLPPAGGSFNLGHLGSGFDNEDFFSTDVVMPSSPPVSSGMSGMFALYENPLEAMEMSSLWDVNGSHMGIETDNDKDNKHGVSGEGGFVVDENGRASFNFGDLS